MAVYLWECYNVRKSCSKRTHWTGREIDTNIDREKEWVSERGVREGVSCNIRSTPKRRYWPNKDKINTPGIVFTKLIEIRLECRCMQKCFLIWNYYVCCLWAWLTWFWHKAKKQFLDQICFFNNKSKILTILFIVKYEKITLYWWVFSVVGAHNQQVFCMFNWGKK